MVLIGVVSVDMSISGIWCGIDGALALLEAARGHLGCICSIVSIKTPNNSSGGSYQLTPFIAHPSVLLGFVNHRRFIKSDGLCSLLVVDRLLHDGSKGFKYSYRYVYK